MVSVNQNKHWSNKTMVGVACAWLPKRTSSILVILIPMMISSIIIIVGVYVDII